MLVRYPGGERGGTTDSGFVQHQDIAATALEAAGITPPNPIDGVSFLSRPDDPDRPERDHVTVGWGSAMTVITDRWWFNSKIDGRGAFLFDSPRPPSGAPNLASTLPDVSEELFRVGVGDARGGFPDYLLALAQNINDAPGCSPFAALPDRRSPTKGLADS